MSEYDKYDEWTEDITPNKEGWYGVHFCWDSAEGSFCGSFYFDGDKFIWHGPSYPVCEISKKGFIDHYECDDWIEENDISF
jgi:hypothetical protein